MGALCLVVKLRMDEISDINLHYSPFLNFFFPSKMFIMLNLQNT